MVYLLQYYSTKIFPPLVLVVWYL